MQTCLGGIARRKVLKGSALDRTAVADLDQRSEEVLHGNDTRGGRKLTVVILVLAKRAAAGRIVQVPGQHIRTAQCEEGS